MGVLDSSQHLRPLPQPGCCQPSRPTTSAPGSEGPEKGMGPRDVLPEAPRPARRGLGQEHLGPWAPLRPQHPEACFQPALPRRPSAPHLKCSAVGLWGWLASLCPIRGESGRLGSGDGGGLGVRRGLAVAFGTTPLLVSLAFTLCILNPTPSLT